MSNRGKINRRGQPRRGKAPRLGATNLTGITSLMNRQYIRDDLNLAEEERKLMGRETADGTDRGGAVDPVKMYTQELNSLANELGIDFLADEDQTSTAARSTRSAPRSTRSAPRSTRSAPRPAPVDPLGDTSIDHLIDDLGLVDMTNNSSAASSDASDDASDSSDDASDSSDDASDSSVASSYASGASDSSDGASDTSSDESDSRESILSRARRRHGIDHRRTRRIAKRQQQVYPVPPPRDKGGDGHRPQSMTEEQEHRQHINLVMRDLRHDTKTSYGMDRERELDVKSNQIEQIHQLMTILREDGVNCDNIEVPTLSSSVDEINSVLNVLRLKNDRNRYSSLAEEVIMSVAEVIESVFDGTRRVPVTGWKPDYTGYPSTVRVKLHRMRYETATVVGNIIKKYGIGSKSRIAIELLPSFFLYPRIQRKQRGEPGLYADRRLGARGADTRNAMSVIRDRDAPPSTVDDARQI